MAAPTGDAETDGDPTAWRRERHCLASHGRPTERGREVEAYVARYRWLILLGLITAAIMEVLDTTIINVALPQMAGNLGATTQEIAWVATGYILSNVVVLPMTAFFTATLRAAATT